MRLLRRLLRSTFLGFAAAYFMDPKRGASRRAQAVKMFKSAKAKVVSRINARRAAPAV